MVRLLVIDLHLKVCVKRPIRDAAELLIVAFRSLYRTISVSRVRDFDRELKTLEWMAIGTEQSFEKTHSITAQVYAPPSNVWTTKETYNISHHGAAIQCMPCSRGLTDRVVSGIRMATEKVLVITGPYHPCAGGRACIVLSTLVFLGTLPRQ
jgi:hypothetical protein